MEDRQINESAPLPLARAFRRYWNSSGARERHDAAYFLFEIYLKYAASIAISRYLAGDARDHRVNAVLKGLVRPSLGEWLRFLRECLRFLAEESVVPDPLSRGMAELLQRKESRWELVLRLHNQLRSFSSGGEGEKTRVSVGDLLGEVVAYRNRVLGHGAPLEAEHYRKFGELFGEAFPELFSESPFLTSLRLVSFSSLQVENGSRIECEVLEHMGLQPFRRGQPLVLGLKGTAPPRRHSLYLLDSGGGLLLLDPLLIPHRDDVYFLNEVDGSPEYLSYSSGDRYRPSGAGSAQGDLFQRILGYRPDSGGLSRIGEDVAPPAASAQTPGPEQAQRRLGDYRIVREVGRGAMGVVFEAYQESLGRRVALKVLPGNFALDQKRVERFRREARATAGIHHPSIVPVYEVGESEGTHFYSMEFIDGPSLAVSLESASRELKEGKPTKGSSMAAAESLDCTVEQIALVAEGLEVAHRQGLVHRDVKPSNILIDGGGRHVLVDFGLVRDEEARTLTRSGDLVGTLGYMSPEQVSRRPVDGRSDVYSLGATLYEVLTLRTPFGGEGESEHAIHSAILFKEPPSPRKLHPRLHGDLETIVLHALEKDPDRRYSSAGELAADLRRYLRREPIQARAPSTWTRISRKALRHKLPLGLAAAALVALAGAGAAVWRYQVQKEAYTRAQDARDRLLPEIERLIEKEDFLAAYDFAGEAERSIPGDPVLKGLWPRLTLACSITSNPSGAEVSFKKYEDITGEWHLLGTTPLNDLQLPRGFFRWKVARHGSATLECGPRRNEDLIQAGSSMFGNLIHFELFEESGHPPGMIWNRPGPLENQLSDNSAYGESVEAPGYWIDRFEVTNEEFQEFVDQGGYRSPQFWKEEIVREGQVLPFEKAMEAFRDRTGKPSPSTWEEGRYPQGKEKHPVAGVSWYEAAAYSEFRGQSLPTIFHWANSACLADASTITRLSNYSAEGTVPVGSLGGIGFTSLSDMAGNVKEWCWNAVDPAGTRRYILGGAYGEQPYQFTASDTSAPLDRAATNGLRCVFYPGGKASLPSKILRPIEQKAPRDYRKRQPVSDEEFLSFQKNFYTYDRTDLKAVVDSIDDSPEAWRREEVSYQAGYGGERISAFIFLPKGIRPPLQAVIYFPGGSAQSTFRNKFESLEYKQYTEFVVRSGRALVYPIYKGTYHRSIDWSEQGLATQRDRQIMWSKEVRRTIDYLETRPDIDRSRLAFYGLSWGAWMGPIFLALDERLRVGVLLVGGLYNIDLLPPADPFNFLPRVKVPVLMVNGEFELQFPLEDSQKPLFDHLGTPPDQKKHVTFPAGHGLMSQFGKEARAEILAWLDRYLGPVARK